MIKATRLISFFNVSMGGATILYALYLLLTVRLDPGLLIALFIFIPFELWLVKLFVEVK